MIGTPAARAAAIAGSASADGQMDDVDARADTRARAESAARWPRCSPPAGGSRARSRSARGIAPVIAASRSSAGQLGVHEQRQAQRARAPAAPRADPLRRRAANSSTPDGHRKHLKPRTPAAASGSSSRGVARHHAAPEADVDVALARGRRALGLERLRRSWSAGMLLSGMSTSVVTPPAAAARVAVVEAFPIGAAGLVDVDVRVDEPGHDDEIAGVDLAHACWPIAVLADRRRSVRRDVNVAGRTPSAARRARRRTRSPCRSKLRAYATSAHLSHA